MTETAEIKKPTAAQARRMRTAARLYAVQALFQMEAADAALEAIIEEFETHRLGAILDGVRWNDADLPHFRALVTEAVASQGKIDQMTHRAVADRADRSDPARDLPRRRVGAGRFGHAAEGDYQRIPGDRQGVLPGRQGSQVRQRRA